MTPWHNTRRPIHATKREKRKQISKTAVEHIEWLSRLCDFFLMLMLLCCVGTEHSTTLVYTFTYTTHTYLLYYKYYKYLCLFMYLLYSVFQNILQIPSKVLYRRYYKLNTTIHEAKHRVSHFYYECNELNFSSHPPKK